MAVRDLTPKQRCYVEAIVAGSSKAAAYKAAYTTTHSSPKTVARNTMRTAKNPAVRAEIDRRTLLNLPKGFDNDQLWRHAVAVLIQLSDSAPDPVRLKSAIWLADAANAMQPLKSSNVTQEQALQKLREVYRKVQSMGSKVSSAPCTSPDSTAKLSPNGKATEARVRGPVREVQVNETSMGATDQYLTTFRSAERSDPKFCGNEFRNVSSSVEGNPNPDRHPTATGVVYTPTTVTRNVDQRPAALPNQVNARYEWRAVPIPGHFPARRRLRLVRVR
jgi:hypothetical protein